MSTFSDDRELPNTNQRLSIASLTSQVEASINQLNSIRALVYNSVQSFEDFTKIRQKLSQILYEYETNITLVIKKVNEIMFNFSSLTSELSRSSVVNEELDNKLSSTYEQINELKYHNSIISSQVKYYKKQCIEKDNYILYLKEKIKDNDVEPLSDNGDISVSYFNYNNIVLPERIKRNKFNDNNYNTISNNESCSKLSYENHNKYGYDYKEESDRNINSLSISYDSNNRPQSMEPKEEIENKIERKGTVTRKIQNVINDLCKCDNKIFDLLQKKYGGDIINKLTQGTIDFETAEGSEKDVQKDKKNNILKAKTLKEQTQKYLNNNKGSTRGWERLKGYLKLGNEIGSINRLHTMK